MLLLGDQSQPIVCTAETSRGLGWFAALYFFVFVLIANLILISLFVGIIIAAMDLLKDDIKVEKEVWRKVAGLQAKYKYGQAAVASLLEIFDLIDSNSNGKLKVYCCYMLILNKID